LAKGPANDQAKANSRGKYREKETKTDNQQRQGLLFSFRVDQFRITEFDDKAGRAGGANRDGQILPFDLTRATHIRRHLDERLGCIRNPQFGTKERAVDGQGSKNVSGKPLVSNAVVSIQNRCGARRRGTYSRCERVVFLA